MWDAIIQPYPNLNGDLAKPHLELGHAWVILSQTFVCVGVITYQYSKFKAGQAAFFSLGHRHIHCTEKPVTWSFNFRIAEVILGMGSANESRRYIVTPPLIACAHIHINADQRNIRW